MIKSLYFKWLSEIRDSNRMSVLSQRARLADASLPLKRDAVTLCRVVTKWRAVGDDSKASSCVWWVRRSPQQFGPVQPRFCLWGCDNVARKSSKKKKPFLQMYSAWVWTGGGGGGFNSPQRFIPYRLVHSSVRALTQAGLYTAAAHAVNSGSHSETSFFYTFTDAYQIVHYR